MIGEYSEGHLLNVAKGVVEKKTANSKILDSEAERRLPKFSSSGTSLVFMHFLRSKRRLLFGL